MLCFGLLMCLIVGVDDFLLDPTADAYFVAVCFSPGPDLRNVIPAVHTTPPPSVSTPPSCRCSQSKPALTDASQGVAYYGHSPGWYGQREPCGPSRPLAFGLLTPRTSRSLNTLEPPADDGVADGP